MISSLFKYMKRRKFHKSFTKHDLSAVILNISDNYYEGFDIDIISSASEYIGNGIVRQSILLKMDFDRRYINKGDFIQVRFRIRDMTLKRKYKVPTPILLYDNIFLFKFTGYKEMMLIFDMDMIEDMMYKYI